MTRLAGILIVGTLGLLGCEAQAPGAAGDGEAPATAGLSGVGLASMGAGGQEATDIVVRRVWGRKRVDLSGDVSFDGRELVFVDYDTGDLAVRDLRTGETRRLTDKGSWEESGDYGMTPKMSRDGQQVAYTWAIQQGNTERYELRAIGMDGTGQRTVYQDASVGWINAMTWAPGGGSLLASVTRQGGTRQILRISVPEGESRILEISGPRQVGHMRFSPDGRFLAFDRAVEEGSDNRDIYVTDADGGREVRLVEDPANDFVLGWAPDGNHILFASDRQGTLGAWLLPVVEGRAVGEPVLVRPDMWRMQPLGFTRAGSFYYGVSTTKRTVYVANLDPASGEFVTAPTPVVLPSDGSAMDYRPTWSPNGRFLAYQSNHRTGGATRPVMVLQSTETGEAREVDLRGAASVTPWVWTRDSRFILGYGRDEENKNGVFKVDVLTGEARPLENFWGVHIRIPLGLSRDEESLFYLVWIGDGAGIAVRGIEGGMEKLLYRWKGYGTASLSPDRSFIAFGEDAGESSVLLLMPASGGESDVLVQFPPGGGGAEDIAWTPDGESVIYRNGTEIWSVPRIGGSPVKLNWPIEETLMSGMSHPRFSADGRRIAFDAEDGEEELWVMENFLPGH